ncbi:T9SS type A sorting domain-containing protein [Geojedonia litorea]|uniref:T9SS type A sorting domain-containing protein n=1 Tax=Geojedonia litorea TaxID=1268269 RepID=A0ABV9N990_9FLAO
MKRLTLISLLILSFKGFAQTVLNADGPGNTYSLITSVLAPGYNPIEAPDCSHSAFGEHIDEIYDNVLGTNVFRFRIHVTPDDDRCINSDRQRNEIKTYDQSPDELLGVEDETVIYKWKFKLPAGFQVSSNFTHLHQLKSVGGALESMPMYTLTARKATPNRLELRYAQTDTQVTLAQVDLSQVTDTWLEVTETITYSTNGAYAIEIKRLSDNAVLLAYSNSSIVNWRPGADFVRPKWGIYRSLINAQDLRDEDLLFASFSIEEVPTLSVVTKELHTETFSLISDPVTKSLRVSNLPLLANMLHITGLDGRRILDQPLYSQEEATLDVAAFSAGVYIVTVKGSEGMQSKKVVIANQ